MKLSRPAFFEQIRDLYRDQEAYIVKRNERINNWNGIYHKYRYPVLTWHHAPIHWRFDLNYQTNPFLQERLGVNTVFNAGAIELNGKIYLIARVEGFDVKSFFAVAESTNGVDNFRFWDYPIVMPETDNPEMNVYDMRLVKHEDGWIYGVFCVERKDPEAPAQNTSAAIASCGIARTKDLIHWERLDDLKTPSPQQRNCVLHPEFVDGKYAFYTRPMDGFISTGTGGGIGWGLADSIEHAVIKEEIIIDEKKYHTYKEVKNGLGPAPLKSEHGWIQLAHGVRQTAAGLRYVLYCFLTDLKHPWKVIRRPSGHFMAPRGGERVGDVSNVLFSNGWVEREDGSVFIYYGSSDTRMHVAVSTKEKLVEYVMNTPEDAGRTHLCARQRYELVQRNMELLEKESIDRIPEFPQTGKV